MSEVIPAIIAKSYEDLKDKMSAVEGLAPVVQLDVCDGEFVPSKCWPYVGDNENDFQRIIKEDEGFPFWETLDFEADLMITNPENHAKDWIKAGARRIILHIESSEYLLDFVKELREEYGYVGESAVDVEIGIGINIETSNEELYKFFDTNEEGRSLADFVQFMGIKNIGYQEQKFDDEVLDKISSFREVYPDAIISIDGGVNFDNAKDLVDAGVNRLVSGSAIYESGNIAEAIETLKDN